MKMGGGLLGTVGKVGYNVVADTLGKIGIQAGTNYYSQWQFSYRYGDPINIWRLQRPYMFELMLPDMGTGWFGMVPGFEVGNYCQKLRFDDYKMSETKSLRSGAYRVKYAGNFEIDSMHAVFLKPIPDIVSSYFYLWRNLIMNSRDGTMNPKNYYAKTAYVRLFDRDGMESGIYMLEGVFPKTVPGLDLAMAGDNVMHVDIEFSVDRVTQA